MDRLSQLLQWFSLNAGAFYAGQICSIQEFEQDPHQGHLHLIKRGPVTLIESGVPPVIVNVPTLIFMPKPKWHRLVVDEKLGADVVCANIKFGSEGSNPITDSLPHLVCIPLADMPGMQDLMTLMESEAFAQHIGRRAALDRLCELLLIHVLRHCMTAGLVTNGVLAGLSDTKLQKVLQAVHDSPTSAWSLIEMAAVAGMSRARFAEHFREIVGETPVDYLVAWRVALAQKLLRGGRPLKSVAHEVGYGSAAALTKAFGRKVGLPPAQWLKSATTNTPVIE